MEGDTAKCGSPQTALEPTTAPLQVPPESSSPGCDDRHAAFPSPLCTAVHRPPHRGCHPEILTLLLASFWQPNNVFDGQVPSPVFKDSFPLVDHVNCHEKFLSFGVLSSVISLLKKSIHGSKHFWIYLSIIFQVFDVIMEVWLVKGYRGNVFNQKWPFQWFTKTLHRCSAVPRV